MPRPKGARDAGYEQKRTALLRKLSERLSRTDETRPSLRQLAAAAGVTVPTLRHYFGTRDGLVESVFAEYHRLGEPFLNDSAEPNGGLQASINAYLSTLVQVMTQGPKLGDIFAVGLVEGMLNERLGPAYLSNMTDPLVDALSARLQAHQARGEMIAADTRSAALILISPVVVACNHQQQMFGCRARPMNLDAFAEDLAKTFVRAYGVDQGASAVSG